jgi:hypothetical protein
MKVKLINLNHVTSSHGADLLFNYRLFIALYRLKKLRQRHIVITVGSTVTSCTAQGTLQGFFFNSFLFYFKNLDVAATILFGRLILQMWSPLRGFFHCFGPIPTAAMPTF